LDYRIFLLGVFLDAERAFDNTSFEAKGRACGAFHDFKVNCEIVTMLSNRIVWAEIRGVSSTIIVRRDCSCFLSLLLLNMVTNSLLRAMRAYGRAHRFADDIAIVILITILVK
jgi:hypothetical protein